MKSTGILALATLLALPAFLSGQVWMEIGDAPDGPSPRQDTMGAGPLTEIHGFLDRQNGDHVDSYGIIITDPSAFYASTSEHLGGSLPPPRELLVDTRVWLWNATSAGEGVGLLLANDNDASMPGDLASTISDPSTFPMFTGGMVNSTAVGVSLVAGQKYVLSISTFDNDPQDAAGVDLADLAAGFTDLHGFNPAAGAFDSWENSQSSDQGAYIIALDGATFCHVPEPSMLVGIALAGLSLAAFRRTW